ncbi:GGDEF domain-containing protein [Solilutibacter tolerans]|uniref:Diguanylate cyclase with GAF sensor n=1 Tax=Solilutibacter tolerans TaxID=1604334 RepID=A0A1N6N4X1_9GAMM|nr:sensor domain-containing diguanylate cyclase [Lysobacter tolerans]SIP87079.1 diguanylate cyclase with GAF sensor [Lysobacter tolerans]
MENVISLPLDRDRDARERRRQEALDRLEIVDTQAETAYDDLARLAQTLCGAPIALVSLVDRNRQWFKARIGTELQSIPREISFCDHAIRQPDRIMEVADAHEDARFANNPLVLGEPHVRFYAGMPILTQDGEAVGAICVVDHMPRALNPEQREGLAALARQATLLLEVRGFLAKQRAIMSAHDDDTRRLLAGQDALRQHNAHLQDVAWRDPLTGLLNRAGMEALRANSRVMARVRNAPYCVALADVDRFKQVNDEYGHAIGDDILCAVADVIRSNIRRGDYAGRLGGEEFVVLWPSTNLEQAREIAERIRHGVERLKLDAPVTISIGLIEGDAAEESRRESLERADRTLYEAKRVGRNRVVADTQTRYWR